MSEKFDYIENIGVLTLEQKRKFYVLLAHNLTVSVRAIWSDEVLSDAEKVEGMKWINEIMHRLVFRIEELHKISKLEEDSWTEKDFYDNIHHSTFQDHKFVAGHVGWAIMFSYKTIIKLQ